MKISPIVGTGVPSAQVNGLEGSNHTRIERAKQIASGQTPIEEQIQTGNPQVDALNARRIKMKTQVSTNRQDLIEQPVVESLVEQSLDKLDTNEPVEVVEETKPLSPQFAALAKAKRALQVKEREIAEREAALKTQNPAGNEDLIAKLKSNPLGVMLENGVTYDQLTEAIIAQQSGATPEINALKAEMKALKEDLSGQFTTRDQQAEQQVLADIKREAIQLAKGEQFEAIREAKAENQVVELIHRTWKKTGEILDTQEAAELVENQLIDEALPFAKLSKVQKRLTPAQAAQVEAQLPSNKPGTKIMRTLTNRDTASPIMDKRARAIAAMQGTLKKG
jgi:hypothetical protein